MSGYGEGEVAAQKLAANDFNSVEELLVKRAAVAGADRPELLSLEGSVAFLAGRMNAAVQYFGEAAAVAPIQEGDAFTLAMALVRLGNVQRAAEVLSQLVREHPQQSLYVYWLGRLDYGERRYPEAVAKLQRALELDPKFARAWDSLGLAFDMQSQTEQAYAALTKAADLNRTLPRPSAWPPHDLGYLCLRMEKLSEAVNALEESLRFDPKLALAHYHLARVLEKQSRDPQAILEYKNAIADDPSASDACYSLAMLYRKLQREREAAAMFGEYRKRKQAEAGAAASTLVEPR